MTFRNIRKSIIGTFLAVCISIFTLAGCSTSQSESTSINTSIQSQSNLSLGGTKQNPLTIKMLDIGQGDAILIQQGDTGSLIDTGDVKHRDALLHLLKKNDVKKIKYIIITHPHADHLGGAWAVLNKYPVEKVFDNGDEYNSSVYTTYIKTLNKKGVPRVALKDGDTISLGKDINFQVFAPGISIKNKKGEPDANNNSIIGKLTYGKFSMLFTGDAERKEEEYITKKYNTKLSSKVLKVGHHGSNTSSTDDFLGAVRPSDAVISVGMHNDYNHPSNMVMKRIAEYIEKFNKNEKGMAHIYRTDEQGSITITTDGNTYKIETER